MPQEIEQVSLMKENNKDQERQAEKKKWRLWGRRL